MSQEQGVDELDALLDSYSEQAARETESSQAMHSKAASKGKTPSASTRLTSGLSQPLPQDNKGLKMMQSMGYKPGSGLGKQGQGMAAPVAVDIRGKRTGLGVEEAKREREAQQLQEAEAQRAKRARLEASNAEAFKDATRVGFLTRKMLQHLHQAWASTAQLLEKATEHAEEQRDCDSEEQSARRVVRQLTALFPKLLAEGLLSPEEVMDAAPASAREAAAEGGRKPSAPARQREPEDEGHQSEAAAVAEAAAEQAASEPAALSHQLHLLLSYLREQHAYCLWCGAAYDSVQQLRECCPGEAEEDH